MVISAQGWSTQERSNILLSHTRVALGNFCFSPDKLFSTSGYLFHSHVSNGGSPRGKVVVPPYRDTKAKKKVRGVPLPLAAWRDGDGEVKSGLWFAPVVSGLTSFRLIFGRTLFRYQLDKQLINSQIQ